MKFRVPPRVQLAERRSFALTRRNSAVDRFAKAEATYEGVLASGHNASLELKRAYSALVAAALELRESIQATRAYSTDVEGWRLRQLDHLDRPLCSCGCGASLSLLGRGRPRKFAKPSCRMRAKRRRDAHIPEATPRLKPGGRANLESRVRDMESWASISRRSRFQSEVMAPFWVWCLGSSGRTTMLPLPISLDFLTQRYRDRLAIEDPNELESFISVSAGRSPRSVRTHLVYLERRGNRVQAESGCGRTWSNSDVTTSDIDSIDCILCRDVVIRAATH
jgi:hypothetical protein